MPPMSRIRLSPTTMTPSAETCCPMPEKLDTVRNAVLTSAPTMTSRTSTGSSAASRTSEIAAALRLRPCSTASTSARLRSVTSVGRIASAGRRRRARSVSCWWPLPVGVGLPLLRAADRRQALGGGDQRLAVERRRAELGEPLAADQDHDPVADVQVDELVGGQQQAGAALARSPAASSSSSSAFDATSTPRVGVIATISRGLRASARATVTFCWLPAGQLADRLVQPGRHDRQPPGQRRRRRRTGPAGAASRAAGPASRRSSWWRSRPRRAAPRSPRPGGPRGCSRPRPAARDRGGPA